MPIRTLGVFVATLLVVTAAGVAARSYSCRDVGLPILTVGQSFYEVEHEVETAARCIRIDVTLVVTDQMDIGTILNLTPHGDRSVSLVVESDGHRAEVDCIDQTVSDCLESL